MIRYFFLVLQKPDYSTARTISVTAASVFKSAPGEKILAILQRGQCIPANTPRRIIKHFNGFRYSDYANFCSFQKNTQSVTLDTICLHSFWCTVFLVAYPHTFKPFLYVLTAFFATADCYLVLDEALCQNLYYTPHTDTRVSLDFLIHTHCSKVYRHSLFWLYREGRPTILTALAQLLFGVLPPQDLSWFIIWMFFESFSTGSAFLATSC